MDHCTATAASIILILSISSLILHTTAVPSTRSIHIVKHDLRPDVSDFCQKTTNPALCTQTLKPRFIAGTVDPFAALDAEIDATLAEAKVTVAAIESKLSMSGNSKSMKASLKVCKNQYRSMFDAIAETKAAVAKRDIISAKFKFSAVISFQTACSDSFDGNKIPFADDSTAVFQLGGNCLDIISVLEKSAGPVKTLPVTQTPSAFGNVIGTVS